MLVFNRRDLIDKLHKITRNQGFLKQIQSDNELLVKTAIRKKVLTFPKNDNFFEAAIKDLSAEEEAFFRGCYEKCEKVMSPRIMFQFERMGMITLVNKRRRIAKKVLASSTR